MRRLLLSLLLSSLFIPTLFAKGYDISKGLYHPELSAMGSVGVAAFSVPNAIQLNPASIAHYNGWNMYWYGTKFENDLDHQNMSLSFKMFDIGLGLSYLHQSLDDIPNTDLINDRIRQNGLFSSSISQFQLHAAKKFTNLLLFKEIDLGVTTGLQRYSFLSNQDLFFRAGTIFAFDLFPDLYFGALLNDPSETELFNYGLQYKQPKYKLFVDRNNSGIAAGGEYLINDKLQLRGGIEPDYLDVGVGLFYDSLYFFDNEDMGINFDYALKVPVDKYPFETQHLFSITVREQDKLPVPFLYQYPPFVNKDMANVVGWSIADTMVQVFYKDMLIDQVKTNRHGYWEAALPLMSEINDYSFKAFQKGQRKESNMSKKYRIIVDKNAPDLTFEAYVFGNEVTVNIIADEILGKDPYFNDQKRYAYFNDTKYTFEAELADFNKGFIVTLEDRAKNESIIGLNDAFLKMSSPKSSLIVTYKDRYQFIGKADIYHSLTVRNSSIGFEEKISLEGKRITVFKPIVPLEVGLNTIELEDEVDKGKVHYKYLIYKLAHYKDIDDADADLLSTCRVLPRNSLFMPLKRVRQHELVQWVASLMNIESPFATDELSVSDAYDIAAAERWVNSRDDMRLVSRGEAMDIIARAFAYSVYDIDRDTVYFENINNDHPYLKTINYFVKNGFIDNDNKFYDPEIFVTRQEILDWFKTSPLFISIKSQL